MKNEGRRRPGFERNQIIGSRAWKMGIMRRMGGMEFTPLRGPTELNTK
jgi:hypothetical protein